MFCSFCTFSENHRDMGGLYQAFVPKKKRVFYHVDCVQWSAGMIRKKIEHKDEYVTHLFEISKKKICYLCGLACPTVKIAKNSIYYYYHYNCAIDSGISMSQERFIGIINFRETNSVQVSNKIDLTTVDKTKFNKSEIEQPKKRKLENSKQNIPNKRISPDQTPINHTLIIAPSPATSYAISPSLQQHLSNSNTNSNNHSHSHSPAFIGLPSSEKFFNNNSNSNDAIGTINDSNDLLLTDPNSLFTNDDLDISPYLSDKTKTIPPPDGFLLDSNPYNTRSKNLSKLISSSSSSSSSSSPDSDNNNIIMRNKMLKRNKLINDDGVLSSSPLSSSSSSDGIKQRQQQSVHYVDKDEITIKEENSNNNLIDNNNSTIIDIKGIIDGKNITNINKYNIHIEERDILEVKITRKEKLICEGLFICVYGPSYYLDSLRSNEPMEIPIERGLPEEEFIDIFNNLYLSQVNLIQLKVSNYNSTCPLKLLFTKLIQKKLVGYLDYNEYELFIIPHGLHLLKYGSFNFLIDRYMRNGPVIPAWILLVSKVNGLFSVTTATANNNNNGNSISNNN